MKLTVRSRDIPNEQVVTTFIQNSLLALASRRKVDEASVLIERRSEESPAYRVVLDVAVPGPNVHWEQSGHSALQAFIQAFDAVEKKLADRVANRMARTRQKGLRTAATRVGSRRVH